MIRVDVALTLGAFALDVAFENDAGITALYGRSGSGKSLTINLIAGLARPDRGSIVLNGRVLVDTAAGIFVPAYRRRIGLVFQDAQLFPHLSVKTNLLFGRWFAPKPARKVDFDRVVETLGIGHLLARKPGRLSGGERQRVAIGRALLAAPEILLMDEPLASLDTERKLEILPLIESLRDELQMPMVYVSHAVDEVARLASRVVVLDHGHVVAAGSVEDVFGPGLSGTGLDRFAQSSVVAGRIAAIDTAYGLTQVAHPAGSIWLTGRAGPIGREVRVVIRATDITLSKIPGQSLSVRTTLSGTVTGIELDGPIAAVAVALDGHGRLFALATRKAIDELALRPGERVYALVKAVALDERAVAACES
jgi:molybdate transport system ATP-binding protein